MEELLFYYIFNSLGFFKSKKEMSFNLNYKDGPEGYAVN